MSRALSVVLLSLLAISAASATFAGTRAKRDDAARERSEVVAIVRTVRAWADLRLGEGTSPDGQTWTHPCRYGQNWSGYGHTFWKHRIGAIAIGLDEALHASDAAAEAICSEEMFPSTEERRPPPAGFRCWRIGRRAIGYPEFRMGHRRAKLVFGFSVWGACEKAREIGVSSHRLWLEKRRGIWRIVRERLDAVS